MRLERIGPTKIPLNTFFNAYENGKKVHCGPMKWVVNSYDNILERFSRAICFDCAIFAQIMTTFEVSLGLMKLWHEKMCVLKKAKKYSEIEIGS